MTSRPLPAPSPWSEEYWKAARDGRLLYQYCTVCESATMYPKRVCPSCLGENLTWRESSGEGAVYTYTEQVAGPPSGFEDLMPYVIAVVRLDEGVQLMTNIVGPDAGQVQCGDRVRVEFLAVDATDTVLPVFARLPAAAADTRSSAAADE